MFQMFFDCTGLESNEFIFSFQKSKSLGTDLAFKERLGVWKK